MDVQGYTKLTYVQPALRTTGPWAWVREMARFRHTPLQTQVFFNSNSNTCHIVIGVLFDFWGHYNFRV